jgi:hypothetical protein
VYYKPNPNDNEADVALRMQHWEGGIRATGGASVPEKSHWYLVGLSGSKEIGDT